MLYTYNKFCDVSQLETEIRQSSITVALDSITTNGSTLNILFKAALSQGEQEILGELIEDHVPAEISFMEPVVITNTDIDIDKRQIVRLAYAKPGWSYIAYPIEFTSAKFNSLYNKDYLDNNKNEVTLKFYDTNNAEVTSDLNESSIVRTEILFKPAYDYEMISGSVRQTTTASDDIRLWVIGGIVELGSIYVKEFASGINLKYIGGDEEFKTDGRASKYMKKDITGVPFQANQLKVILKHPPGFQHNMMIILEFFRA